MTMLRVEKIGGVIGAVVDGVELRDLDAESIAEVESALYEHGVLFFRSQHLDDDEQIALAGCFGTPSIYPVSRMHGADVPVCSTIVDGPDSPPSTDSWHTDVTWIAEPPKVAILCGLEIPEYGGDTMWASAVDVYQSLSPAMRSLLDGQEAVHDCWPGFCTAVEEKSGVVGLGEKIRDAYPPVRHPVVRTHPVTGARAYFDGADSMGSVDGLRVAEWETIRAMLRAMFDEPKRQVRWRWTEGDVAIWDERLVVHRGVSDHAPLRRVVRRITVDGERPVFVP